MYPYHLGIHLKTGRFCRIMHPAWQAGIPQGFARVIRFKRQRTISDLYQKYITPYVNYDGANKGELRAEYWSLPRWTDLKECDELDKQST